MPKNILLFCDGTNNQFDGDHTNVLRTFKLAVRSETQTVFYDPGVGTMPEPWTTSKLGKRWSMIKGLAFGEGLLDNLTDAYEYLMKTYEEGDRVYLFGFSRGAYTARALAGLLHAVGLLRPGTENLIRYAITYWEKHRGSGTRGGGLCAEFKATMSRPCPIHFMGVWDTVGSVGFINHFKTFPYTHHNPEIGILRHAVSLDERRCCFRQNLAGQAFAGQDVQNVWFAGVHSDVGGGYLASQSGLAKIAFRWMVEEARKAGMMVDDEAFARELADGSGPDCKGMIHRSLEGFWWLVELIPTRRYTFADKKLHWRFSLAEPRGALRDAAEPFVYLHRSVLERMNSGIGYAPKNLPASLADVEAKFKVID